MTTLATTLFWVCAVIGLTGGFALFRGRSPADREDLEMRPLPDYVPRRPEHRLVAGPDGQDAPRA